MGVFIGMGVLISVILSLCAAMMLVMSATFCVMARKGKSPASSKAFALLFGLSGALLLALQGLQLSGVLPEDSASIASAVVTIGAVVAIRLLRAKFKPAR